jgi:hypothetical protein
MFTREEAVRIENPDLDQPTSAQVQVVEAVPVSLLILGELFDFLDRQLAEHECEDNLRMVLEFLVGKDLPARQIITWMEANGGYCDCQTLENAEEIVFAAVPGFENLRSDPPSDPSVFPSHEDTQLDFSM